MKKKRHSFNRNVGILGIFNDKILLTKENCLILKTEKYPNGGKFLITGTKVTKRGYSHQLTDLTTGERVKHSFEQDSLWVNCEEIEKMKV